MEDEQNLVQEEEELLDADLNLDEIQDNFPEVEEEAKPAEPAPKQAFGDIVFDQLKPEEDVDKQCDDSTIIGRSN